jgi:hypothetical protein
MSRRWKVFSYFLLVGLLLNSVLLGWLWFGARRPDFPRHAHGPVGMATEILNLDLRQQKAFQESARRHHQRMVQINEERVRLFFELPENVAVDSLSAETEASLIRLEQQRWKATRRHFSEVKILLRPEQLPRFEDFCKAVLQGPGLRRP